MTDQKALLTVESKHEVYVAHAVNHISLLPVQITAIAEILNVYPAQVLEISICGDRATVITLSKEEVPND